MAEQGILGDDTSYLETSIAQNVVDAA